MTAPFQGVADDIYVRAPVLDSGDARTVVIVADVPMMAAGVAADLSRRIAAAAEMPEANIVLATSHTHNAMRVDPVVTGIALPGSPRFVERVSAATMAAIAQAEAALQPARVGTGRGHAALVANRNQWSLVLGRYIDGIDRSGNEPIDTALGVVKGESLAGKPIAFLLNYAIEPTVAMAMPDRISGDVPGATERYIENRVGGGSVALFTVGAAGSPLYKATPDAPYGRADPRTPIDAMGTSLGEEAIAVSRDMDMRAKVAIGGRLRALQCPGKTTTPLNLPNRCAHTPDSKLPPCDFRDADAPPVTLKLGVLRIGDMAMVQADANVTPALGRKLAQVSPLANTWVVALTYGPFHYVMDDAAYPQNTYEATAGLAKHGCAGGWRSWHVDMSRSWRGRSAPSIRRHG